VTLSIPGPRGARGHRHDVAGALLLAASAACLATPAHAQAIPRAPRSEARPNADSARVPAGLGVPAIAVTRMNGVPVVGANDFARLLGASRSWRADVRKLVLRLGEHRLTFTDENPFVIADDHTLRLENPVRARAGELQIPVEIARLLPEGTPSGPGSGRWPRLAYDADAGQLRVAPVAGFVGAPRVETRGGVTILVIPAEHPEAVAVVGRSRARFRVRVPGALIGALPDSLPDDALVRDLSVTAAPGGITFELAVDPDASGWRLDRDASGKRAVLTLARGLGGLEEFASEGPPGARVLRTVVLDPGHGGADPGVRTGGTEEKSLALDVAHAVADELRRRVGVRVVLTREDDRDLPQEVRAETANRARADAVLSIHFGAFADPRAHGAVAWCPPAGVPGADGSSADGQQAGSWSLERAEDAAAAGGLELLPWRDAALPRAVESRGLAEQVTAALQRHGFGPASVRERLPYALVGVLAPGVLLECGTLSDPDERARLLAPGGLRKLAAAIADGVVAWQRND